MTNTWLKFEGKIQKCLKSYRVQKESHDNDGIKNNMSPQIKEGDIIFASLFSFSTMSNKVLKTTHLEL